MSLLQTMCPNCQAIWTLEEIEDGICDACGYPDLREDEEPDGSDDDYDRPSQAEIAERQYRIQRDLK